MRAGWTSRGARASSTSSSSTARDPRRARARAAAARARRLHPLVRELGRRHARVPQAAAGLRRLPAEPRGGDQGARGGHRFAENLTPVEALPDDFGARRRWCSSAAPPTSAAAHRRAAGAHVLVAAGTQPERHLREGAPGHVPARQWKRSSSRPSTARERRRPGEPARRRQAAGPRWASSPRYDGRQLRQLLRRQPSRATPATSSRRWRRPSTATRTWSRCSRTRSRRSIRRHPRERASALARARQRLDDELLARRRARSTG